MPDYADMRGTFQHQSVAECEPYLEFLHQLSDMGAAMRDVIASVMLDKDIYATLTKCT